MTADKKKGDDESTADTKHRRDTGKESFRESGDLRNKIVPRDPVASRPPDKRKPDKEE